MCIKIGDSEFETVRALMGMSLNAVIIDTFDLDLDDLELELSLKDDLAMDDEKQQFLYDEIEDIFDGLKIDFSTHKTVGDLFQTIITAEFEDIDESQ